ncbi:hypothetical protein HDU81_003364 [Chytriomyces hyalinus]|nr:hypothetical protein HDU81_003364 [Chytriomyces hyalinus]
MSNRKQQDKNHSMEEEEYSKAILTSAKRGKKQKQEEFYARLVSLERDRVLTLRAQNERAQMQLAYETARMERDHELELAALELARMRKEFELERQVLEQKRLAQRLAFEKELLDQQLEMATLHALLERAKARHALKPTVSKRELDEMFPDLAD